jgi:DNA-binding MarR family transcriptional regulator
MRDSELDSIVENMMRVLPAIRGGLLNVDLDCVAGGLSHPHVMIMKMLDEHEKMSASAIGHEQFISRPHMTHIIDKLVDLGMVERTPDKTDRRVINITLTARGREVIRECDGFIKRSVKERLSALNDQDIKEMSASLCKLAEVVSRLR